MLCFIFIALTIQTFPKYAFIYADTSSTGAQGFSEFIDLYMEQFKAGCDQTTGDVKAACLEYVEAYSGTFPSTGSDINTVLGKVPNYVEFLFVIGDSFSRTIDFNYLPRQMSVFMLSGAKFANVVRSSKSDKKNSLARLLQEIKDSAFDGSQAKFLSLAKSIGSISKSPQASLPQFPIVGSIKSKVSYLTIIGGQLKVSNSNLNCHTLFLSEGSTIPTSSYLCYNEFFIADKESQALISESTLIRPTQYGIYLCDPETPSSFRISYKSDRWEVLKQSGSTYQQYSPNMYVKYTAAKTFSVLVNSYNIDINLEVSTLNDPASKPINLTIIEQVNTVPLPLPETSAAQLLEQSVTITSSGYWNYLSTKPALTITTDRPLNVASKFQLDYTQEGEYDYFAPDVIPFPPYAFIYADTSSTGAQGFSEFIDLYMEQFKAGCDQTTGDVKAACLGYVEAYSGTFPSTGSDINTVLGKVPNYVEFLFVIGDSFSRTIDFNYLPRQMSVFMLSGAKFANVVRSSKSDKKNSLARLLQEIKDSAFDGSQAKFLSLAKSIGSISKSPQASLPQFPIVGSIKSKVSYLTIIGGQLKVSNSNLNCHTLFLSEGSTIPTSSYLCYNEFFIADKESQALISESTLIRPTQYGIYLCDPETPSSFRISYKSDRWEVLKQSGSTYQQYSPNMYVKYTAAKTFSVLVNSYNIDINLEVSTLNDPASKPINLTIIEQVNTVPLPLPETSAAQLLEQSVTITSSGYWNYLSTKPTVTVTTDRTVNFASDFQPSHTQEEEYDYFGSYTARPSTRIPTKPPTATQYYPTSSGDNSGGSSFGPGAIAGTTIGGAAGIGGIIAAILCCKKGDGEENSGRPSSLFDNMNND
ncbi:hypothetical protein M9Y10_003494 [Tritrichomonas musculus]|uniref:VWFA domain-containing protein n=1 Tax=Tritrichomonas musculus TaxID=1915356 RepID=A0ABR2JPL0_9EUKA